MEPQALAGAGCEPTSFASLDNLLGIFYRHWPIETFPESLSS
jgi:hypothetical protein